jgi:hypothetical protein
VTRSFPDFAPLSLKELRSFLKKYPGNEEDIERLVLEIRYSRGIINGIDVYFNPFIRRGETRISASLSRWKRCACYSSSSACCRASWPSSSPHRKGTIRRSLNPRWSIDVGGCVAHIEARSLNVATTTTYDISRAVVHNPTHKKCG